MRVLEKDNVLVPDIVSADFAAKLLRPTPRIVTYGGALYNGRIQTVVQDPLAEIGFFPVHEIAWIKSTDALDRPSRHEHSRAYDVSYGDQALGPSRGNTRMFDLH
jgi:hypothetical protein